MKADPDHVKICHRCEQPVRLTREAYEADAQTWTTCDRCRAVLAAAAAAVGADRHDDEDPHAPRTPEDF